MEKLCCDICGGTLIMQSGGKIAVCDSCGMQYSVERMREKVQEIRGVISVEGTVKTQDADFIIRGGVLERYNGNDTHVVIPDSVVKIGQGAFEGCVGIQSVTFPRALVEIGALSFYGCSALKQVVLPETVKTIGSDAFRDCISLEIINVPAYVQRIGYGVFWNCPALCKIIISEEQKEKLLIHTSPNGDRSIIGRSVFEAVDGDGDLIFAGAVCAPWYLDFKRQFDAEELRKTQEKRRAEGKCQHCGGSFSGVFTKKCVRCGKPKNY